MIHSASLDAFVFRSTTHVRMYSELPCSLRTTTFNLVLTRCIYIQMLNLISWISIENDLYLAQLELIKIC